MRHTLLTLLLLGPALPAFAGDGDEPAPKGALLNERDADGDGKLSPAEFGPDRAVFDLLDRDGDGFLTAAELPKPRKAKAQKADQPDEARGRKQAERFLRGADKDGDGKIGMSEWTLSRSPLADADRNGDQLVDIEELTLFFAAPLKGGKGKQRPGDAMPMGPGDGERMGEDEGTDGPPRSPPRTR